MEGGIRVGPTMEGHANCGNIAREALLHPHYPFLAERAVSWPDGSCWSNWFGNVDNFRIHGEIDFSSRLLGVVPVFFPRFGFQDVENLAENLKALFILCVEMWSDPNACFWPVINNEIAGQ